MAFRRNCCNIDKTFNSLILRNLNIIHTYCLKFGDPLWNVLLQRMTRLTQQQCKIDDVFPPKLRNFLCNFVHCCKIGYLCYMFCHIFLKKIYIYKITTVFNVLSLIFCKVFWKCLFGSLSIFWALKVLKFLFWDLSQMLANGWVFCSQSDWSAKILQSHR